MRKNFTKAVAAILSVCVTMTSVSWENFIVAKSAEAEEMTEPENVTAENEIEEERTEDSTKQKCSVPAGVFKHWC